MVVQPDSTSSSPEARGTPASMVIIAWLIVSIPLAWGVFQTIRTATALFR